MISSIVTITFLITLLSTPSTSAPLYCRKQSTALATLSLPSTPALPAPDRSWTLAYVALGLGTQNYTCASPTSAPVPGGAMATLYDAMGRLTGESNSDDDSDETSALPSRILSSAKQKNSVPTLPSDYSMPQLGLHYFTSSMVPTFDLSKAKPSTPLLAARKVAAVAAPDPAANVAWLQLVEDGTGVTTGGLKAVYRVETAGGVPPTSCQGKGATVVMPYAAEYWFYTGP